MSNVIPPSSAGTRAIDVQQYLSPYRTQPAQAEKVQLILAQQQLATAIAEIESKSESNDHRMGELNLLQSDLQQGKIGVKEFDSRFNAITASKSAPAVSAAGDLDAAEKSKKSPEDGSSVGRGEQAIADATGKTEMSGRPNAAIDQSTLTKSDPRTGNVTPVQGHTDAAKAAILSRL